MTLATTALRPGTLTRIPLATIDHTQPRVVPGFFWRVAVIIGDLLALAAIALSLPFVIIVIGLPIVLTVRIVLWILGML
jgi:hypothetical protein